MSYTKVKMLFLSPESTCQIEGSEFPNCVGSKTGNNGTKHEHPPAG